MVRKSGFVFTCIMFCVFIICLSEAYSQIEHIFAVRRQALMEKIDDGVIILCSSPVKNRNGDVSYKYRQDSDFYYLTGFKEPGATVIIAPEAEKKYIMFVRSTSTMHAVWSGKQFGPAQAMEIFGADTAFANDKFDTILPEYLRGVKNVYCNSTDSAFRKKLRNLLKETRGEMGIRKIRAIPYVHEMRLIKDDVEIKNLQKAIDITCDSQIEVMRAAQPGMYEFEIKAIIEYIYQKNNALYPGFPSIVGSGPNATVLHYHGYDRKTEDGDLVLMDIGAEYNLYTADVTRTIPMNGKFSPEQKEIYELVLESQKKAINFIKPGVGLYQVHSQSVEVIKDGLLRLGLITDKNSDWQYRCFLMYNTNHWLGLDVHDVGGRGPKDGIGMLLQPGMVLTVEPGIYIGVYTFDLIKMLGKELSKNELNSIIEKVRPAVEKYMNIGIRIEDDILVTEDGRENLSKKAPREISEIEALMAEKSYLNQ